MGAILPFQKKTPVTPASTVGSYPRTAAVNTHPATASEPISGPAIVHVFYNASGQAMVRNANAATGQRPARGYVQTPVSSGGKATVYLPGSIIGGFSGLQAGADYWLDSVNGQITTTPPSASGSVQQYVGTASSATQLSFNPDPNPATNTPPTPVEEGVTSFNGRQGAVGLLGADVIAALGYSPMPAGSSAPIIEIGTAGVALTAGQAVSFTAGGVVPASAADYTKPCHGFVLEAVVSGAPATVYLSGQKIPLAGLAVGVTYWLSPTTPGALTTVSPMTAGQLAQSVGFSPDGANLMTRWDTGERL